VWSGDVCNEIDIRQAKHVYMFSRSPIVPRVWEAVVLLYHSVADYVHVHIE